MLTVLMLIGAVLGPPIALAIVFKVGSLCIGFLDWWCEYVFEFFNL